MSIPPTTDHVQGPAIRVQGLEKSYKQLRVLRGVDLDVARGSIFALLGSNGAGKTTMVKILSTLLKADAGTARVNGFDVAAQAAEVRESISLTGQFTAVDEILSGRENLVLVARLRHLKDPGTIADDLLRRFSLTEAGTRRVATYSGGMRRRLDIAMSLIGSPPVIFLDEPTAGLDPQARIEVWQAVKKLADKMMTVRTNAYTKQTEYLGIVGNEYGVVQNEQVAETLELLSDEAGGAIFETGGSMNGGKEVFITMKLPTSMQIAGVDDIDLYLNACTSHDGRRALRIDASPVRVVCKNTLKASFRASKGHYTFRHTSNVANQISQCREAMGLMWRFMDEFEAQAERMLNEALTLRQFEHITAQLWPLADDAGEQTVKNHKQRRACLRYLLRDAPTQTSISGTRWAGYQALSEYIDHYAPAPDEATRAARAVSDSMAGLKTRAFELLSV